MVQGFSSANPLLSRGDTTPRGMRNRRSSGRSSSSNPSVSINGGQVFINGQGFSVAPSLQAEFIQRQTGGRGASAQTAIANAKFEAQRIAKEQALRNEQIRKQEINNKLRLLGLKKQQEKLRESRRRLSTKERALREAGKVGTKAFEQIEKGLNKIDELLGKKIGEVKTFEEQYGTVQDFGKPTQTKFLRQTSKIDITGADVVKPITGKLAFVKRQTDWVFDTSKRGWDDILFGKSGLQLERTPVLNAVPSVISGAGRMATYLVPGVGTGVFIADIGGASDNLLFPSDEVHKLNNKLYSEYTKGTKLKENQRLLNRDEFIKLNEKQILTSVRNAALFEIGTAATFMVGGRLVASALKGAGRLTGRQAKKLHAYLKTKPGYNTKSIVVGKLDGKAFTYNPVTGRVASKFQGKKVPIKKFDLIKEEKIQKLTKRFIDEIENKAPRKMTNKEKELLSKRFSSKVRDSLNKQDFALSLSKLKQKPFFKKASKFELLKLKVKKIKVKIPKKKSLKKKIKVKQKKIPKKFISIRELEAKKKREIINKLTNRMLKKVEMKSPIQLNTFERIDLRNKIKKEVTIRINKLQKKVEIKTVDKMSKLEKVATPFIDKKFLITKFKSVARKISKKKPVAKKKLVRVQRKRIVKKKQLSVTFKPVTRRIKIVESNKRLLMKTKKKVLKENKIIQLEKKKVVQITKEVKILRTKKTLQAKQRLKMKTKQLSSSRFKLKNLSKSLSKSASALAQLNKSRIGFKTEFKSLTDTLKDIKSIQDSINETISTTIKATSQAKSFKSRSKLKTEKITEKTKKKTMFPFKFEKGKEKFRRLSKPVDIYEVRAKKRGKQIILKQKLTELDAKNYLATELDTTLLRTARLVKKGKSKKVVILPKIYKKSFSKRSKKLRPFKIKQGKKKPIIGYIEKRKYALDTKREKLQIKRTRKPTTKNKRIIKTKSSTAIQKQRLKNLAKARAKLKLIRKNKK